MDRRKSQPLGLRPEPGRELSKLKIVLIEAANVQGATRPRQGGGGGGRRREGELTPGRDGVRRAVGLQNPIDVDRESGDPREAASRVPDSVDGLSSLVWRRDTASFDKLEGGR